MSVCRTCEPYFPQISRRYAILLVSYFLIATLVSGRIFNGRYLKSPKSYCNFNYGLPHKLIWDSVTVDTSPELGINGTHKVIYNAITGTAYVNYGKFDAVTYVTHGTPEYLYHVLEIARYWDGPISLAVYVPDNDLYITMQIMNQLCHCFEGMSKVSLHLVYPTIYPPKLRHRRNVEKHIISAKSYLNGDKKAVTAHTKSNILTFRKEKNLVYFINVGRNVARNASRTNYFLMSDIEMVPSDGLAPKFLAMVRKLMGDKKRDEGFVFARTVFVVPLFEVERGEEIPRDKQTLIQLVNNKRARYFHKNTCPECQKFPALSTWLTKPAQDIVEPLLYAKREVPYHRWEPLYFGTNNEPWYSEILSWEGEQEKMIQMLELCLQGYELVILDGGFLCHAAAPRRTYKARDQLANFRKYRNLVRALAKKYEDKPECSIGTFLPSNWRDAPT